MNLSQKRKILQRIADLEHDISELNRVRVEIATSGYSSASFSSGGGSKSYTRLNLESITATLAQLQQELKSTRNLLKNSLDAIPNKIYQTYY